MTSDGEKAPVGRVHGPGVAPRDIQYEVFGPDLWQADLASRATPELGGERVDLAGGQTANTTTCR